MKDTETEYLKSCYNDKELDICGEINIGTPNA